MAGIREATKLPNVMALDLHESEPTELETIDVVQGQPWQQGNTLVRVGCAVTNERFRLWCVKKNRQVTLPLNVIMVECTLGGSTAPMCHGAGRRHETLSDLVRKVEYVDVHGKLQTVEDAELLRAAGGSFGVMGVVTHLTMELSPMTYAQMSPVKLPVLRAIPPPPDMKSEDIPAALRIKDYTPEMRAADQAAFEERANNDYYAEWFWFPFSDRVRSSPVV